MKWQECNPNDCPCWMTETQPDVPIDEGSFIGEDQFENEEYDPAKATPEDCQKRCQVHFLEN